MKSIYKFPLRVEDIQMIDMPVGIKILTVQTQNEIPCIWGMIDKDQPRATGHWFRTFGTGHPIDKDFKGNYIGTYQLNNESLVFHVFEFEQK